MFRTIQTALALSILLLGISCNKQQKEAPPLTQQQIQEKVDSIVAKRSVELKNTSAEDLRYRLKIEVKPMADSIVALQHRQ